MSTLVPNLGHHVSKESLEECHYKADRALESFTIDLNLLEKSNYKEIDEVNLKKHK